VIDMFDTVMNLVKEWNVTGICLRLALATFVGVIIGLDREYKNKGAGIKTHALVCIGAAMAMIVNEYVFREFPNMNTDITRLGAQVISGIGFLGVGTIIVTGQRHVSGLTTAASLWTSACIGLAVGIGFYSGAIFTTLGLILVFKYAKYIEVYVEEHSNTYDVYMEFENEDKMSMAIKKLREEDILISNVVIIKKRSKTQSVVIQATMEAAKWKARHTVFREVRQQEGVISVEEI
jgi:putative Mg2+ transporter-C (MgtC) family protein